MNEKDKFTVTEQIDLINTILNKKLDKSGKQFLTLAQANKALLISGKFSRVEIYNNSFLKRILESGLIPNSLQTKSKPKQWRIFHSKASHNIPINKPKENWWEQPNSIDPNFSNKTIVKILSIFGLIILIFLIAAILDPKTSHQRNIETLKTLKEYEKQKEQTDEIYKMMKAHPEAFEQKK